MGPTIQLIQLTMRFEHQEKVQRHASTTYRDRFISKQSGLTHRLQNHIRHTIIPPRRQQRCECA